MNIFIRKVLRRPYRLVRFLWRINIVATLWINFKMLPFQKAIKFPIHCFGKIKFHDLSGKIIIDSRVKTGMIKIGFRWLDLWPTSYLPTQVLFQGYVFFRGSCTISGGVYISSFKKESILDIGNDVTVGGGSMIKAMENISIGKKTRITGNCTVFDSNMHYVKDIERGIIGRNTGSIKIENNCWINAGSVLTKGAVIPAYSIVARNSFIGKDMSEFGKSCMFAGSPAKMIKKGVQRIFNYSVENDLNSYFRDNPKSKAFIDTIGLTEDLD